MAVAEGWNFPEKHDSKAGKQLSRLAAGEPLGPPGGVGRLGKARRRAAASGGEQNGGAKEWMDPCGAKDQAWQE